MDFVYEYASPIGDMTMASDGASLTGLWFNDQKYFARTLSPEMETKKLAIFDLTASWLDIYFGGSEPDFMPDIKLDGTPFQLEVWELLGKIEYGKTTTYGSIANEIAKSRGIKIVSAQAVGGAVGKNPISILVPCHRVLASNGSLTGYAAGLDKKEYLLKLEKSI